MIFRTDKDKNNPYVVLNKGFLNNKTMSWKAKGLLAYLLSLPDDWEINLEDLQKRSTDRRDSIRTAFVELKKNGYVVVNPIKNKGKFKGVDYIVYEVPKNLEPEKIEPMFEEPVSQNMYYQCVYFSISKERHKQYKDIHPLVDLDAEYVKMFIWLEDNPAKRKKGEKGYNRFISHWLSNARVPEKKGEVDYDVL